MKYLEQVYYNNTVLEYLVATGLFVLLILALRLFRRIVMWRLKKWSEKTKTTLDDFIIKVIERAVFPLLNRDELKRKAKEVFQDLRNEGIFVEYDDSGSIGRRYRRQDEIGTPYCVTIDYDTLEDDTVTIRERDTMKQIRVPVAEVKEVLLKGSYGTGKQL